MKNSQKFTALVIIIGALILSGFLIFNKLDHELSFGFPITPGYEKTITIEIEKNNTEKVAGEIVKSIIEKNPEGPTLLGDKLGIFTKDPEEIVTEILDKSTTETKEAVLSPKLYFENIEIIENASKENIAFYLDNRSSIIVSAGQDAINRGANLSNPNIATFSILLDTTSHALAELYALPVPKKILSIHKEQIRLLAIQENIFKNLVNYERDPLVAAVSVSLLFSVNEDLLTLSKTIAEFIEENNIKI